MKVEVARPGLPVPNKPTVSVDVKQHSNQPASKLTVGVTLGLRGWGPMTHRVFFSSPVPRALYTQE